jgi:hypothetical protein
MLPFNTNTFNIFLQNLKSHLYNRLISSTLFILKNINLKSFILIKIYLNYLKFKIINFYKVILKIK